MSVIAEVKSAVLILIGLHLAAFGVMVGYRMHTQQYYMAEAAIVRELAKQAEANALEMQAAKQSKKNETQSSSIQNPLEDYQEPVQRLTQSVSEAQRSIESQLEALHRSMQELERLEGDTYDLMQSTIHKIETAPDEHDTTPPSLNHWRELLSVGSLREIPDDNLEEIFENASTEIMGIVGVGSSNQHLRNKWTKQFLFDTGLGATIAKEPSEFVCPAPLKLAKDSDGDVLRVPDPKPEWLKHAAYASDLDDYLQEFEAHFGNRIQARGVEALLPKSRTTAENLITQKLDEVLDDIYEFADELEAKVEEREGGEAETKSSCIDPELITAMVSAGLNAQTARTDVQEALRQSIRQYDPQMSIGNLILDADLGGAGSCEGPPRMTSINLRSAIDSPLLMKSIDWIDVVVDSVGGYNDDFDQYLDHLTGLYGTTSIGEILVEGILEQAGKVGDIHVEKYLDKVQNIVQSITGSN